MEELLKLGETTRSRTNFGRAVLQDPDGRSYQLIEDRYRTLLDTDNSFDTTTMRAFDFKLMIGRGKKWQEAPRVGTMLSFVDPDGDSSTVCMGIVKYVNLGHRRSYGLLYLEDFKWFSANPDFTI